ncbi:hypothetical protein V8C42DRAFT_256679 [Trichoderma barbatum]
MGNPIVDLGLSCPKSGRFYICEDQPTRFVGCCTINPCITADGLCPDDDLRPASFSPDAYAKILAQDCLDPGFLWYTCRDSSPPFLGCCSQMACESSGCPVDKVGAAALSGNKLQAAPFLSSGSSSSSSSTSTTSEASSTTMSTAVSTTASTTQSATGTQPAAVSHPVHTGLSKGAIGGIAVGAVAGVCILATVAFWALRQRKKKSPSTITAVGVSSGLGRKDEYGEDTLTEYQDGTAHTHNRLGAGAGQMEHAQLSPGLESSISELPATPSTPGNRHIVSMTSSDGVTGRESELSGLSAPSPPPKQQSPLIHQSLFELEDSSSRTFVGR